MQIKPFINLETVQCPACDQRMPFFRLPDDVQQLMWGGWTCPHCACRMDKWGNALPRDPQPKPKTA